MLKRSRSNSNRFFGLLLWRRLNRYKWHQRLLSASILSICGAFTLPSMIIAAAPNAQLQDWRFSPEIAQLEFTLSAASQPNVFFLAQPSRLVIDLPGTKLGFVPTQQNYSGPIQRIRLSQLNASVTRIVLDFAPGIPINPSQVLVQPLSPTNWVLRPFANISNVNLQGSPTLTAPQLGNNIPPGGIYAPLPPNNTVPSLTAPQLGNNIPPGGIYAPLPRNTAPSQTAPQPSVLIPPPAVGFPITNTNNQQQQQPFVTVPPLNTNNSSQPGSLLPPATFTNPSGGIINTPPLISPNYNAPNTVPTIVPTSPDNPINNTNPNGVIPWGQSLPIQR